jgi:hypothetical protein
MPVGATSSATPIVTSLAALVYSIAPDMTANEVKKAIVEGCDDIGDKGVDVYTGHGRVNFGKTDGIETGKPDRTNIGRYDFAFFVDEIRRDSFRMDTSFLQVMNLQPVRLCAGSDG